MSTSKVPPITALKALEPRPGGHWTVQDQEGDAISLSYVLDGAEAMAFDLRQCKSEEDVRKYCSSFVYEYTDNVSESGWHHQPVGELSAEIVHSHEAASLLYHSQSQNTMAQYSAGQIQQPLQEQLLFGAQAAMVSPSESQAQVNITFGETAVSSNSQYYQPDQSYSLSNGQELSQDSFASGTGEWPLSNEFFPMGVGNVPISMPNPEVGITQDATAFLGRRRREEERARQKETSGGGSWSGGNRSMRGAKELLGDHYEDKRVAVLGVKSHMVEDLNAVSHLPLQFTYPDPRQLYNYASSTVAQPYQAEMPHLEYFAMTESDTFDLDNPWDFDKMLGYKENEGDREAVVPAAGLPQPNNQYNPHDEFFYTF
ncbi:hypothetical protein BBK36DRAFT_1165015 [Trichoderma citrinoviride]|uniref:Uncharacterized protein n=1 Tax=Trichoderma citrinoviride TaxID=58853 RepID=A0A2T4BMF0_9HYPO|nr:hypothetical protein BBK36DRAFT_1165015 [Trichoderma citrinoviride]PTB70488.1 hypothetical protein BBK36DRAFT_1165015 [Trichoderma citrinoviride]